MHNADLTQTVIQMRLGHLFKDHSIMVMHMRKKFIFIAVGCLLCSSLHRTDDWPMFQHDLQRTGFSTSDMPESLRLLWEVEEPYYGLSYLIISEGNVIVAFDSHAILSLNITDGSLQWKAKRYVEGFPAASAERIYVGFFGGILCLDADTGEELWRYDKEYVSFDSPLIIDNYTITNSFIRGLIFGPDIPPNIDEERKKVLCFDAETGETVWEFFSKEKFVSPPLYHDNKIYAHDGTRLYCLDVKTGEPIWEKESDTKGADYLLLSQDERIFVVSYGGVVNCLQRKNGDLLWQFDCGSSIENAPALGYGKVFFTSAEGMLYCLDARRGKMLWRREVGHGFCSPLIADGKVALGGEETLYIVNAFSGKILESFPVEDQITSIALSDGNLMVGTWNGKILCLRSSEKDSFYQILMTCIGAVISIAVLVLYAKKKYMNTRESWRAASIFLLPLIPTRFAYTMSFIIIRG